MGWFHDEAPAALALATPNLADVQRLNFVQLGKGVVGRARRKMRLDRLKAKLNRSQ